MSMIQNEHESTNMKQTKTFLIFHLRRFAELEHNVESFTRVLSNVMATISATCSKIYFMHVQVSRRQKYTNRLKTNSQTNDE